MWRKRLQIVLFAAFDLDVTQHSSVTSQKTLLNCPTSRLHIKFIRGTAAGGDDDVNGKKQVDMILQSSMQTSNKVVN